MVICKEGRQEEEGEKRGKGKKERRKGKERVKDPVCIYAYGTFVLWVSVAAALHSHLKYKGAPPNSGRVVLWNLSGLEIRIILMVTGIKELTVS
jgi:hypothetical protein